MSLPGQKFATARYHPRAVVPLELWKVPPFTFKVYGLSDQGRPLDLDDVSQARDLITARLADIEVEPGQQYPGFVIVHKGSEGMTLTSHWWVEGCILCQDLLRRPYNGEDPIAAIRPHVVGCIWELTLINHERTVWQKTMMPTNPDVTAPELEAYLQSWFEEASV